MWVHGWVYFRAKIFKGGREAFNYDIAFNQFCDVRGTTLKSIIDAKLEEIGSISSYPTQSS